MSCILYCAVVERNNNASFQVFSATKATGITWNQTLSNRLVRQEKMALVTPSARRCSAANLNLDWRLISSI